MGGCQQDVDEEMPSYAINACLTGTVVSCSDRRMDTRRAVRGSVVKSRATRGTRLDGEEGREDGFWTSGAIRGSAGTGEFAVMRGGSDCVCVCARSVRRGGEGELGGRKNRWRHLRGVRRL